MIKLHSARAKEKKKKKKKLIPRERNQEKSVNPESTEISNLILEIVNARFPCQEFKNSVLKHLLKTDVALCDIGTRLLGSTRCRAWPEKEPRECEVATYILWLHSVPYKPSPWRPI